MTADGYYVELPVGPLCAPSCGELSPAWVGRVTPRLCHLAFGHDGMHRAYDGTEWIERHPDPEWQDRHADLAATLRTVLAMCAHTEQHHPGGPAYLACSIRDVIEGATVWPSR